MKKLIVMAVSLIIAFNGCKKEELPAPDENGYIWLRDVESLSLIKKTIQGTWKIHKRYGGYTGKENATLTNSYLRLLPNDSLYIVFEGEQFTASKADFVHKQAQPRYDSGYPAWILNYELSKPGGSRDELIIDYMYKDRLVLVRNAPNTYAYSMTKISE